ncbi:MAG: hypothetical protein Q8O89_05375, partial [Nanoarchaeota archaeon]|nr:hypothetical protein [Nanoarchaeota archaeon]
PDIERGMKYLTDVKILNKTTCSVSNLMTNTGETKQEKIMITVSLFNNLGDQIDEASFVFKGQDYASWDYAKCGGDGECLMDPDTKLEQYIVPKTESDSECHTAYETDASLNKDKLHCFAQKIEVAPPAITTDNPNALTNPDQLQTTDPPPDLGQGEPAEEDDVVEVGETGSKLVCANLGTVSYNGYLASSGVGYTDAADCKCKTASCYSCEKIKVSTKNEMIQKIRDAINDARGADSKGSAVGGKTFVVKPVLFDGKISNSEVTSKFEKTNFNWVGGSIIGQGDSGCPYYTQGICVTQMKGGNICIDPGCNDWSKCQKNEVKTKTCKAEYGDYYGSTKQYNCQKSCGSVPGVTDVVREDYSCGDGLKCCQISSQDEFLKELSNVINTCEKKEKDGKCGVVKNSYRYHDTIPCWKMDTLIPGVSDDLAKDRCRSDATGYREKSELSSRQNEVCVYRCVTKGVLSTGAAFFYIDPGCDAKKSSGASGGVPCK